MCCLHSHSYLYCKLYLDIQCHAPFNGEITSCSSGTVGVGNKGDTCSFTCNSGYELTGNGTRACQNNGSWSGTEIMCRRIRGNEIAVLGC